MIRIVRGTEPAPLARIRRDELRRVDAERKGGGTFEIRDRYNHPAVRASLYEAQHQRCCYCEREIRQKAEPIEHFRPKRRALRGPGLPEHGYWWLAWTWRNLFIVCAGCNRSKADKFPLQPSSPLWPEGQEHPAGERPVFIDPSEEDPIEAIRFEHVGGHWRPVARNGSIRGAITIREIGLDDRDLIGKYNRYVDGTIRPLTKAVRDSIAIGDQAAVAATWADLAGKLFGKFSFFQGLAYDVVDGDVPPATRARWGLDLKRPPHE